MKFSSEETDLKVIDGGRGKTGGVAMQGCGGQVHTFNIHIYIHLAFIHNYTYAYTYHTNTYTHIYIYIICTILNTFSVYEYFRESCHGRKVYITSVPDSPSTEIQESVFFSCILFILHTYIHPAQMHMYIQHTYVYAPCTYTYIQQTDIHRSSTNTNFFFSLIQ